MAHPEKMEQDEMSLMSILGASPTLVQEAESVALKKVMPEESDMVAVCMDHIRVVAGEPQVQK